MRKENEEMIKQLKERLQWYTQEASKEEFDEEEVALLSQLLQKMCKEEEDAYFNPDASLKRFQKRYGLLVQTGTKDKKIPFYRRKGILIKAAVFVAVCGIGVFFAGGHAKAIRKDELEFFQILSEDEMGRNMVINGATVEVPEEEVSEKEEGPNTFEVIICEMKEYQNFEDVKGMSGETMWIPNMKEIQLQKIATTEAAENEMQVFNLCYLIDEQELWCSIYIYPKEQATVAERYQFPLTTIDTITLDSGLSIEIKQAPTGELFGEFFSGRCTYLFSGEFSQVKFTEIMMSLERCRLE